MVSRASPHTRRCFPRTVHCRRWAISALQRAVHSPGGRRSGMKNCRATLTQNKENSKALSALWFALVSNLFGSRNMNPVPFATAHEYYNSRWQRQWAALWAVLVGGKCETQQTGALARSVEVTSGIHFFFSTARPPVQTAHKLQMSRAQKAHCGNAQEFLCKKRGKKTNQKTEKTYRNRIRGRSTHTTGHKNEKYLLWAKTKETRRKKTIADDLKIY